MLDQGYSLVRVELSNWGNFHGYQKFDLRSTDAMPGLLAPPSASAILGINGSGKSTLIDALMITLLPFENSLKLGMTNDVESGSSGGRTIRDYVLGKHSATNGSGGNPISGAHGRSQGCSIVLLQFQHNRTPSKQITIGRIWWYQNQVVSESQVAFIAYEPISIAQLCREGKTPRSGKDLRLHVKENLPQLQTFETMQSYFTALSGSLGQISRDDLKILNRAFYVKSISNIDHFIRENMLLEQENPHLERLLENVRNGKEIAVTIEACEKKITAIQRLLKDLERLKSVTGQRLEIDRKLRVLAVHKDWFELKILRTELENLKPELLNIENRLPGLTISLKEAQIELEAIQSQLAHHDLNGQLQQLDVQIDYLGQDIRRLQTIWDELSVKAKPLGIKLSFAADDMGDQTRRLAAKNLDFEQRLTVLATEAEKCRQENYEIDRQAKLLREEFEHLTQTKTLISKDLFSIKEEAIADLEIPRGMLMFVGELIQVKDAFKINRRAIESVLFPISRNLLCHPDYLHVFTKWLDAKGLKADVTAKRISQDELASHPNTQGTMSSAQILSMIELLPKTQHPFHDYLWTWLFDTFDYCLVDLKDFRSNHGKLVTREGLVKTDTRTMRKMKQNLPQSLGWDNKEAIESLSGQLQAFNLRHTAAKASLAATLQSHCDIQERKRFCLELTERLREFAGFAEKKTAHTDLQKKRQELHTKSPEYLDLKDQQAVHSVKVRELQKDESVVESQIGQMQKRIHTYETLLPVRETELKNSSLYTRLAFEFESESSLVQALDQVEDELKKRKLKRLDFESVLQEEASKNDLAIDRSRTAVVTGLEIYRREFDDPNMPFQLPENRLLPGFVNEWTLLAERLNKTELPQAQEKWKRFFDQILVDSVKDTINEIKSKLREIEKSITAINEVLKLTNFEDLPTEKRYLKISIQSSPDERIRKFRRKMLEIEKVLGPAVRAHIETQSQDVMGVLVPFVEELQQDISYRNFVTDVRHHFVFEVHSLSRSSSSDADSLVEVFSGSRRDAKSSAQTTQLAYTLLASCLAYRFKFHDPVGGQETPRILILDEFGGKFDNEKPREILKLLDQMGFQSILVSPMSKADLLAESISHLVLVHKVSATHSKVQSYPLTSKEDYERLLQTAVLQEPGKLDSQQPAQLQ